MSSGQGKNKEHEEEGKHAGGGDWDVDQAPRKRGWKKELKSDEQQSSQTSQQPLQQNPKESAPKSSDTNPKQRLKLLVNRSGGFFLLTMSTPTGTSPGSPHPKGKDSSAVRGYAERSASRYGQGRRETFERAESGRVRTSGHLASFFHPGFKLRKKYPYSVRLPGRSYEPSEKVLQHQDCLGRRYDTYYNDDRYLSPIDGHLAKLVVQSPSDIYEAPNDTTWRRSYIQNMSPLAVQIALWPTNHFPAENPVGEDYFFAAVKWLPSCFGLLVIMSLPVNTGDIRNNGNYDVFPYRYYHYPKSAKNSFEDYSPEDDPKPVQKGTSPSPLKPTQGAHEEIKSPASTHTTGTISRKPVPPATTSPQITEKGREVEATEEAVEDASNDREQTPLQDDAEQVGDSKDLSLRRDLQDRALRPRRLQVLKSSEEGNAPDDPGYRTVKNPDQSLEYVFVAFTAEQFPAPKKRSREEIASFRQMEDEEIPESQDFRDWQEENFAYMALHDIGVRAAREAGLPAFWVGASCMDSDDLENEVYRINDIIRGASRVVIALGHEKHQNGSDYGHESRKKLLAQWGKRVWTFPEVLLANQDKSILVYTRDLAEDPGLQPYSLARNQFANQVWTDASLSREMLDHYLNNLQLSRLELPIIALKCLQSRDLHDKRTGKPYYLPGDRAYALSGLLRKRPKVDKSDSSFQAFARLSLANDSDQLLERLICVLPKFHDQQWDVMDDFWNVNLWDIEPSCQISGIGDNDTVVIDGARAAAVRWKSFAPVANATTSSWRRLLISIALHGTSYLWYLAIVLISTGGGLGMVSLYGLGVFFLILTMISILFLPVSISKLFTGKILATQSWFFGVEGYVDIQTVETKLFGAARGRLAWSPYGSSLSRHKKNKYDECEGVDPWQYPEIRDRIKRAAHAPFGEEKIFTLVDTTTMTCTLFPARRPPIAFLITGQEGGMQRAVGVSYDWATGTVYRECVLRMETPVKEKMGVCGRLRFGLARRRPDEGTVLREDVREKMERGRRMEA